MKRLLVLIVSMSIPYLSFAAIESYGGIDTIKFDTATKKVINPALDFSNVTVTGLAGVGGASTWGGISGAITNQADLVAALAAKQPLNGNLTSFGAAPYLSTLVGGSYAFRDAKALTSDEIDNRLVGLTAGNTAQNLYSTLNNSGSGTYVRSTTWLGKNVNLTCVPVFGWNGGALVSPRHIIYANHAAPTNGTVLRFVTTGNAVVTRTITSSAQVGTTDIRVAVLDSDVPSTITFASVIKLDQSKTLVGAPIFYVDQNQKAWVGDIITIGITSGMNLQQSAVSSRSPFWKLPVIGDSGCPVFVIMDGNPVLITTFESASGGPSIAFNYDAVNASMASLGGGYSLTQLKSTAAANAATINASTSAQPGEIPLIGFDGTVPYGLLAPTLFGSDGAPIITRTGSHADDTLAFDNFNAITFGVGKDVLFRNAIGSVSGIWPKALGGTGTATPGLVQGTNVTITGTWPNQTINSSGSGSGLSSGSITTTDSNADNIISPTAVGKKALVIQMRPSQTANLFEIQDSTGAARVSFGITGVASINTASTIAAGFALKGGGMPVTNYVTASGNPADSGWSNIAFSSNMLWSPVTGFGYIDPSRASGNLQLEWNWFNGVGSQRQNEVNWTTYNIGATASKRGLIWVHRTDNVDIGSFGFQFPLYVLADHANYLAQGTGALGGIEGNVDAGDFVNFRIQNDHATNGGAGLVLAGNNNSWIIATDRNWDGTRSIGIYDMLNGGATAWKLDSSYNVTFGGSLIASSLTANTLVRADATKKIVSVPNPGTNGYILSATTAGVFSWIAPGNILTDNGWNNKGDLLVGSANNTAGILGIAADGKFLKTDSSMSLGMRWGNITGSDLTLSDVTTNDVSTSTHGFAPKLPNDSTKYLNGVGAYTVPASTVTTATVWDSKGDLLVGSANNTAAILGVGSDGKFLISDSTQTLGLRWAARASTDLSDTANIARLNTAPVFTGTGAASFGGALSVAGVITAPTLTSAAALNLNSGSGTDILLNGVAAASFALFSDVNAVSDWVGEIDARLIEVEADAIAIPDPGYDFPVIFNTTTNTFQDPPLALSDFVRSGANEISPTALSGNVNDYNPTGLSTALSVYIDGGAADRNITGLAGGTPGRIQRLVNRGTTNKLTLKNQDTGSSAANRFLLPADTEIPQNTSLAIVWDSSASRWRPWSRALSNSGVTAASYTSANITVDAQGRVTAAANGSAGVSDVVTSAAYAATITPAVGTIGARTTYNIGTLTGALTVAAPTGTPVDSQELYFRFVQDGTGGRVITWNAAFAFGTDVTTTLIPVAVNAKWEQKFQWHAGDSKWRAVGIVRGF